VVALTTLSLHFKEGALEEVGDPTSISTAGAYLPRSAVKAPRGVLQLGAETAHTVSADIEEALAPITEE
jgi:hypothetical protein